MAGACCHNCVYSICDPQVWLRSLCAGESIVPQCANHPWYPGRLHDVPGTACRNYRPKPILPHGDAVRMIPLGDGFYAYVDAADYEWLSRWSWHLGAGGYAARSEKGKTILMHRQIMQPPKGMLVDHIDSNGGNNCRFNLRICTHQENQRNMRKQKRAVSRYKGAFYDKRYDKWYSRCRYGGKYQFLGYYDEQLEAARAYDLAAVTWFGAFARLNFPQEWPPERRARARVEWEEFEKRIRRRRRTDESPPTGARRGESSVGTRRAKGKSDQREKGKGKSRKAKGRSFPRKTRNARRAAKKAAGRRRQAIHAKHGPRDTGHGA